MSKSKDKPKKAPAKSKAKPKKNGPGKGEGGRPKIEFTPDQITQVFKLAKLHCTHEEIAGVMSISIDTVRDRIRDEGSDFSKAYIKGREMGRRSLRRAQFKYALAGSHSLLIFLGKNLLGQKDKMDMDVDLSSYEQSVLDLREREAEIIRNARNEGRMNGTGDDESEHTTH